MPSLTDDKNVDIKMISEKYIWLTDSMKIGITHLAWGGYGKWLLSYIDCEYTLGEICLDRNLGIRIKRKYVSFYQ